MRFVGRMTGQAVSVHRHTKSYSIRKENVMIKQGQNAKTISCIKADTKEPVAGRTGHYQRMPVDNIFLKKMDYKREQEAAIHFAKCLKVKKAVSTETVSYQGVSDGKAEAVRKDRLSYKEVHSCVVKRQEISDQKITDIQTNREMTLKSLFSKE